MTRNLIGQKFGRLTVVQETPRRTKASREKYWLCDCDCGGRNEVTTGNLRSGGVRSCGCLAREAVKENGRRSRKHGYSGSPTYTSWNSMLTRCHDLDSPEYGGRGISACDRWDTRRGGSFENFLADMGERPIGRTLDRIDVDGNYEPSNCRWATTKEQAANKRDPNPWPARRYNAMLRNLPPWVTPAWLRKAADELERSQASA